MSMARGGLTRRIMRRSNLLASAALAVFAVAQPSWAATRKPDEAPSNAPQIQISQATPKGFENIDNTIETEFDIVFSGRRLGAVRARVANGKVTILDPDAFAQLLPPQLDRAKIRALIAQPLDANEDLRCPPGQTVGCGTLPEGQAGLIVNPENFSVTLIVTPDYIAAASKEPVYLGAPVSGPSLIQKALVSVSAGDRFGGKARFGGTFDTLASIGRTSFVAQTLARDNGANLQRAYGQRFWSDRQAQLGLLQESQSLSFTSYRMVGAEFGSFYGSRLDAINGPATPLQIVLPRAAVVEVYRDGVLIQTTRLDAGIQQIDTTNFPGGSYPVRIVARDGNQILVDQVQQFTRIGDLPPPGKWAFDVRGGMRVRDFQQLTIVNGFETFDSADQPFLPSISTQSLFSASLSHRIGGSTGIGLSGLVVGSHPYGELSGTTYHNNLRAIAAVAAGTDKSYSILTNASIRLADADISISARHTRVHGQDLLFLTDPDVFRPFFRSEDSIVGSVSVPLLKGQLTVNGSYSRTPTFRDQYAYGARYTKSFDVGRFGLAQLAIYGLRSTTDTQFGVTVSFFKRVGRRSLLSYGGGAEYRHERSNGPGAPDGVYPVVNATLSRNDRIGDVDLNSSVGAGSDSERDRVFASADATAGIGHFDGMLDYQQVRGQRSGFGFTGNLFSGFVIGGGHAKLGIRDEQGDAIALVSISRSKEDSDLIGKGEGRYRILLGNQFAGTVAPGGVTALSLPSFRPYKIGLQPENSPPYSIDLTPKTIPLYPGNVALVDFHASRIVTLFGRLIERTGQALPNARVSGSADSTFTDTNGYFVITAEPNEPIDFYDRSGAVCRTATPSQLIAPGDKHPDDYHPIGNVVCSGDPNDTSGSPNGDGAASSGVGSKASVSARQALEKARKALSE